MRTSSISRRRGYPLAMEFIAEDEYVEVTPQSIRERKKILPANQRPRRHRS